MTSTGFAMQWITLSFSLMKQHLVILAATAFLLPPYANAEIPMTVDDSLVSFSPPVYLTPDIECQGVRIARELVATSPSCAQAIQKQTGDTKIKALDFSGNRLGNIVQVKDSLPLTPLDSNMLLDLSETVASEFGTYPVLRNSDTPPSAAFAYFKDDQGAGDIISQPVSVTRLTSVKQQHFYDVSSDISLPSGTMVFDDKNRLICLISIKNQCISVPLEQAFLTRKLNQYEEDTAYSLTPAIVEAGAVLVLVAGTAGTFYTALFFRARYLGIPAGTYWGGICSNGYCKGWNALSTVFCGLGTAFCIPTGGYSCTLCWAAPFTAAWNWLTIKSQELLSPSTDNLAPPEYSIQPPTDNIFEGIKNEL
jgi:hypothetical protein